MLQLSGYSGWAPIGPLGNLDPAVWYSLSAGQEIAVPGLGTELLHHVHADDVAQAFQLAVEHRDMAAGESFNVVAPSALTARGFLAIAAGWFGKTASIRSVSWAEFKSGTTAEFADSSWQHLSRSQYASIREARTLLGYDPTFEPGSTGRHPLADRPCSARGGQPPGRLTTSRLLAFAPMLAGHALRPPAPHVTRIAATPPIALERRHF